MGPQLVGPQPGEDAVVRVLVIQPAETGLVIIRLIQGRFMTIEVVEIPDQPLLAAVPGVLQQVPGQLGIVIPLVALGDLGTHEVELLAGVGIHEAHVGAQVGGLLPLVPGHLVEQGVLAVDHLVVGEGQNEVLVIVVHHGEGHVVVVVATVNGLFLHVAEGVVHPAHIPLEAKPQATEEGGTGDPGKGGGLLSDGHGVGVLAVHLLVGPLQEADRLVVVVAAIDVGHPLTGVAGVIQIEHGGDRIHPQAVDVELVEPEQGAGHQELAHGVATEVIDVGVPVRVPATARIFVLVERRAVEAGQAVGIGREVGGHPIQNHADPRLVALIHEVFEIVGRAVAAGGGEHAHRLVAPGAAEGVLGDRQQLDVGVLHLLDVIHQFHRQLAPAQAVAVRVTLPGAHVQLVDGEGLFALVIELTLAPGGVLPLVLAVVIDH